jgi:hypothetical protein
VRLDVGPPLTSTTPLKLSTRPQVAVGLDDDRVAYCTILDYVPSESSSSSSGETSSSESILPSPPLVPNLYISPPPVPEAEVARHGIPIEVGAHVVAPKGLFSLFA